MLKLTQSECSVSDRMELTSRTITDQGYLVAPAIISRTGVQSYKASELGIGRDSGMDPNTVIRLYRPAEEVFAPESMQSFDGVPTALNHPPGNIIDAKNWRDRAVGDMDDVAKASDSTLGGKITVRDSKAVAAVQSGKKYLSAAYKFNLDPTPGTSPDGQAYDGVQRAIRGNHVAIVDVPRGGPVCHISDSTNSGGKAMRKLVVDGISFETEDSVLADAVTKLVSERDAAIVKNKAKVKVGDQELGLKDPAPIQAVIDGLTKEITEIKAKQVSDADIEKRVAARVKVVGDALKLVPDFKVDGKTDVQIQREVLSTVIAKDEAAKQTVTVALDGVTVEAADGALLSTVFRIVASKAPVTRGMNAADHALSDALNGSGNHRQGEKLVGRDAYVARMNGRGGEMHQAHDGMHSHSAADCPCN